MRKKKLVVLLLMLLIILLPSYDIKAEEIKAVKSNTHEISLKVNNNTSIEFLETDDISKNVCKDAADIRTKSIVLVALFIIVISSKCAYTALKLRNYDKYWNFKVLTFRVIYDKFI